MSDINSLFDDHENRKMQEQNEVELKRQQEQEARQVTTNILKSVVVVIFEEVAASIRSRGYGVEIKQNFDEYTSPWVEFIFNPSRDSMRSYTSSSLRYIHNSLYNSIPVIGSSSSVVSISMRQDVWSTKGGTTKKLDNISAYPASHITADNVRKETLAFVKKVLDSN